MFTEIANQKGCPKGLNIDILNNAFLSKKERCPVCPGSFIRRNVLTVASPFLVVYGDGSALKTYPKIFSVLINKKECNYVYRLSYVGMKRELRGERFHNMSVQEYKNKFWHYLEVLDSNPLTTFLSLPDDVAHEITFVLYICLSLLPFVNYKSENKIYNRRKGDRRPKKKATRIEVEAKLIERRIKSPVCLSHTKYSCIFISSNKRITYFSSSENVLTDLTSSFTISRLKPWVRRI